MESGDAFGQECGLIATPVKKSAGHFCAEPALTLGISNPK
jgi:hypothetical protein